MNLPAESGALRVAYKAKETIGQKLHAWSSSGQRRVRKGLKLQRSYPVAAGAGLSVVGGVTAETG